MKKLFFILLFSCVCTLVWASVEVKITTKKIIQGKPFVLVITDDNYSQVVPNIAPLQQDFFILGTEQRASVSVVNNTMHSQTQWIIHLEAKKSGKLTIPSLHISGVTTKAIPITVTTVGTSVKKNPTAQNTTPAQQTDTAPKATIDTDKDVILNTEVSTHQPYLNQQVIYTMRLFNSRRLVDVEFTPPSVENALMFPLGDGNRYETIKNGKRYAVEEQRYAVFPLKSGEIKIIPPTFNALIYDGFPQRIRPKAKVQTLQVKPVPKGSSVSEWLPASNVELEENYSNSAASLKRNETLVREVTIKALGITSELLPEQSFASPKEAKLYKETPERKNYLQNKEVLGTLSIKLSYLFNTAGEVCIPPYTLSWFNTKTKKIQQASLPKHCLTVQKSAQDAQKINRPPSPKVIKELEAIGNKYLKKPPAKHWLQLGYIIAGLIILILVILAIFYLITLRRSKKSTPTTREIEHALKKACAKNDPLKTRDYFLQWIRLRFPSAHALNLADAANLTAHQALMGQVNRLSKVIYTNEKRSWHGKDFWDAFTLYQQKKNPNKKNKSSLPPINPY